MGKVFDKGDIQRRAAERRAARRPAAWTPDYALGERLKDDGLMYEIVALSAAGHPRVVLQALDGAGRPEGEPFQRLAERDGVRLDSWGRRARRLATEVA
jgi:hypothetical protein